MRKTLRSPDHSRLVEVLISSRKAAGLTQDALARRLKKHQSFVAKYENGERRLDIVEFVVLARALGEDPERLFKRYLKASS